MHHKGKAFNALCNNRGDLYIYDPERFISAQRYNFLRFRANTHTEKVEQEMLSIVRYRGKTKNHRPLCLYVQTSFCHKIGNKWNKEGIDIEHAEPDIKELACG